MFQLTCRAASHFIADHPSPPPDPHSLEGYLHFLSSVRRTFEADPSAAVQEAIDGLAERGWVPKDLEPIVQVAALQVVSLKRF